MVGMFTTLNATSSFLYDRRTFSPPLTYPGARNFTVPNGINDRGEIVGVYQDAVPGEHSFLYKAGTYEPLIYPGAKGTHGFVYLENVGVFTPPLGCPIGTVTALQGINHGGQIVGGCIDAQGNEPHSCTRLAQSTQFLLSALSALA